MQRQEEIDMKNKGYIQKIRAAVLAVGMLLAGIVCWGQQASVDVNIETITASSNQNQVPNLTDDNNQTTWRSASGYYETDYSPYLILDLGSVQNVDVVNIRFSTRPSRVTVTYSTDDANVENGNSAGNFSNFSNNRNEELEFNRTISARYIRLAFQRRQNNAVSVAELSLAANISYSNIRIVHKQGQWYDQSYQNSYQRTEVADLYGNDTFDEGGGWTTTDFGAQMQNTHEYRVDIYMNPRQTRTLTLPGNMSEVHHSMYNYQRWYDYKTDGITDRLTVTNGHTNYTFANGLVGGTFLPDVEDTDDDGDGHPDGKDKGLLSVRFSMPAQAEDVYYVACVNLIIQMFLYLPMERK